LTDKIEPGAIDLIVYDFDGVMTDNRVLVLQDGTEAVFANRADGLGVNLIRKMGIAQLILSTETNPVVQARASKLGIEAINGCADKRDALTEYCIRQNMDISRVVYIGNDTNDLEVMATVGYPVAPADAHKSVKAIACHVTSAGGGEGVVKEFAEMLETNQVKINHV